MPAEMLVGRRLAVNALRSAVDAALRGAGGVVLLAGEAGMGKTALASEAVAYAKTRGAAAVWGTCWEGDGAPGFWPWIQVMRGLAADEVGRLIEKVCGEHPPAPLIQAVHERTAGNPFFAQQIAQLLAAQGVPLDRAQVTGVPPVVGDVLARRLARLPGKVVDLLAVASVVGRRFPIETVAAIAGVPAGAALPLLDGAVRAAVLEHDEPGRLRFSHDLFRDVLYDGLPAARRSALHLTAAELLERRTAAAEIAYHRSVARPRPCGGASHNCEARSHAIRAREGDPDGNRRTGPAMSGSMYLGAVYQVAHVRQAIRP